MSQIDNSLFDPQKSKNPTALIKIAKVIAINGNSATVQFDGESTPSNKYFKSLKSYTPQVGDRVLMLSISGSYIILGNF